jgi:hypothetical protein
MIYRQSECRAQSTRDFLIAQCEKAAEKNFYDYAKNEEGIGVLWFLLKSGHLFESAERFDAEDKKPIGWDIRIFGKNKADNDSLYFREFFLPIQEEEKIVYSTNIKSEKDYDLLLKSGMFWVAYPELTGSWDKDAKTLGL